LKRDALVKPLVWKKANKNNKQANQQIKTGKRGKFEWGRGKGLREETERPCSFIASPISANSGKF